MYKNNIISISGMPVSGKSTTINTIIEKLKERGYDSSKIHLISTGKQFREVFNDIVNIIKNYRIDEKGDNLDSSELTQKLLSQKGFRDIIIKTIVKLRKNNYDISNFSIEQANNLEEFKDLRNKIDELIDTNIYDLGNEINSEKHEDEIWLIDSRLAFSNIPDSFSVRLTVDDNIAGERLINDKTRGKEDNQYRSINEAKKAIINRRNGEQQRYLERYNVDLEDTNNYDLIIDTSYSNVEDIAETIINCNKKYRENEYFGKKWSSPKKFLPTQSERMTLSKGSFVTLDQIIENIKEQGYYEDEELETICVDNRDYIVEGHHRNFGAARAGKTLVPYITIAEDDECIPGSKNTARTFSKATSKSILIGHEWIIDENFSYEKIYPGIYKELEEREEER